MYRKADPTLSGGYCFVKTGFQRRYISTDITRRRKKRPKKRGANAESIKTHDLIGQDGKDKGIKNEKMKKKRLPIWNRNKPTGNQSTE
jgi:hypothetical protein